MHHAQKHTAPLARTAPEPVHQPQARPSHDFEARPSHDAATLTSGGREARIRHQGQVYTLRITRAGKLILTK